MKKVLKNECKAVFPALSKNESLSRSIAAAFLLQCDPTVEETAAAPRRSNRPRPPKYQPYARAVHKPNILKVKYQQLRS